MRILAISGSLRSGSHSTALLRAAAAGAPDGVEFELYEPERLKAIPPYDADDDFAGAQPAAVQALRDELDDADAVLVATPEYNHSIPGVLKNALDWASRPHATNPLRGKPAAVIGASTGMFGAVWAQAETRKVLGALGARVIDDELPVARAPEGLDDVQMRERLAELLRALTASEELARAA
jgi:chromate reductase